MLSKGNDPFWNLGFPAAAYLRGELMNEVLGIEAPPEPPAGWEGSYLQPVGCIEDFLGWLDHQLNIRERLGGNNKDHPSSGELVRNAGRLVAKLGLQGMPLEPLGPFTLNSELAFLRNLRRSCPSPAAPQSTAAGDNQAGESHPEGDGVESDEGKARRAEGTGPISDTDEAKQAEEGAAQPTKPIPGDEANIIVRNYLDKHKDATAREVSVQCGIALGRVSAMPAWQAHQARKGQSPQAGKQRTPRQLTEKMLAAIGQKDDPSAAQVSREEAAWRYLVESANTPEERARLNSMTKREKSEAIQAVIDQQGDK
jgi:hypothetical protein